MTPPIIKRDHVQLSATTAKLPGVASQLQREPGESPCAGEKGLRLLRDGDDVCAIEFTCACGEVTVVEFQYPADSANATS